MVAAKMRWEYNLKTKLRDIDCEDKKDGAS
jgi:hypothetical protein